LRQGRATTVVAMDETPAALRRGCDASHHDRPASHRGGDAPRSKLGLIVIALVGALVVGAVVAFSLHRNATPWSRATPVTVSGWVPYWQASAGLTSFSTHVGEFADVSMFAYRATAADAVGPYPNVDPAAAAQFVAAAGSSGAAVTASVVDDTKPDVMAQILSEPQSRALHVQTIVQFAAANNFAGIDLDYENFAFNDGRDTWDSTRPNWVAFVTELADALHKQHRTLTVSAPYVLDGKQTSDSGYWVYDYAAIGKVVDRIRIMAYDYSTTEPGPIAPLSWVRAVVVATKKLVPASKLVLGIPVYGRDWAGDIVGTCPPDQTPKTHTISATNAETLAASEGIVPMWADHSAERTFTYTQQIVGTDVTGAAASCTVTRTVWYSDAQSVYERAWVAERQDLSGVALFPLGSDVPAMWQAIDLARANTTLWPVASTLVPPTIVSTSTTVVAPVP